MGTIASSADNMLSQLEDQLALWNAKLDLLVTKAEVAGRQAKLDSSKRIDQMKVKLAIARSKLDEAKAAGTQRWDSFKEGLESSWEELEGAFQKLTH